MCSVPLLKLSMSTGSTQALLEEQFLESIFKCVATIAASEEGVELHSKTVSSYTVSCFLQSRPDCSHLKPGDSF